MIYNRSVDNLQGAKLDAANLNKTDLRRANFRGATVQQAIAQDNPFAIFIATSLFTGAKTLAAANIPTFGWNIDPEWAVAFCRRHNDELAALVARHPGRLAGTAALAAQSGAKAIDLNFGCPATKVTRKGGGAAVPVKRNLTRAIMAAAVILWYPSEYCPVTGSCTIPSLRPAPDAWYTRTASFPYTASAIPGKKASRDSPADGTGPAITTSWPLITPPARSPGGALPGEADDVADDRVAADDGPALRERLSDIDYVDLRFDERLYVRPAKALHAKK